MGTSKAFDATVRRHDAQVAATGLAIWVGAEPTFTDRGAQSPPWLSHALGGDKAQRALDLLARLHQRLPGSVVLRSVGRFYPGEDEPRWSLGLYRRRDGTALWAGPPDPLLAASAADPVPAPHASAAPSGPPALDAWAAAVAEELAACGFLVSALTVVVAETAEPEPPGTRVQLHATPPRRPPGGGPARPPGERPAAEACVFTLDVPDAEERPTPRIELPKFDTVADFLAALQAVGRAGLACRLPALIVAGCQPPVDASVELTTITPDPAVIEINAAPSPNAEEFLRRSRQTYAAAADEGLSPYRLYFNGAVADSGGGGQITLGGPSPLDSPFLREPMLLPRLVGFFNRHPALSYLYSHDHVGSSGQSARADERGADAVDELGLALALLERQPNLPPQLLWQSLAPFLCDASGNSHRAEINIEKLWNPYLPDRGQLGLVEFRALRMQHTAERATAMACLLRAVAAMLARESAPPAVIDWGRELHQRFALPYYLEQDLQVVFQALEGAGLGLGEAIRDVLIRDEFRLMGRLPLPGCTLEVRRALEFWPLLGDSASPEQGGTSRLVDASTARVELRLRPTPRGDTPGQAAAQAGVDQIDRLDSLDRLDWREWRITAAGVALPLRQERDVDGELALFGLRFRRFVPSPGLHPMLGAQPAVRLLLRHPGQAVDHRVTLHEWQPAGEAYPGLPGDLDEASRRRAERVTLERVPRDPTDVARAAPVPGLGPYSLDLRWLP